MTTIGILVDPSVFRGIRSGRTGSEQLALYCRAAGRLGLTPIFMSLETTSPASGKTRAYRYVNGRYVMKRMPIPKVIHNRTLPESKRMRKRLALLSRTYCVFNARNRYSKYRIHKLLGRRFASHLPVTVRYTRANLRTMMKRFDSLFLKPQSSSIGKGILKIDRVRRDRWKVRLPRRSAIVRGSKVGRSISAHRIRGRYLIQQTIPLAKYKGRPFDFRVTVQRGAAGAWQVTGMFGKVARKGRYVTNVARGGKARKAGKLLRHRFPRPAAVADRIRRFSLEIARYLGGRLPRMADAGLDIGVDSSGKPHFIEMNGRDQRYGFKKANMKTAFYRAYETPMLYAKYLLQKRNL